MLSIECTRFVHSSAEGAGVMDRVLIRDVLDTLPVPALEHSLTTFLALYGAQMQSCGDYLHIRSPNDT